MATEENIIRYQAWDSTSWLEFDGASPMAASNNNSKDCQHGLWSAATWDEGSFSSSSDKLSSDLEDRVPLLLNEQEGNVDSTTPINYEGIAISPLRLSLSKSWSFKKNKYDNVQPPSLRSALLDRRTSWKNLFESVSSLIWNAEEDTASRDDTLSMNSSFSQKHVVVPRRPSKGNPDSFPHLPVTHATGMTRHPSKETHLTPPPLPKIRATMKTNDDRFCSNEAPTRNAKPPLRRSYRHRFVVSKIIHMGHDKNKTKESPSDWIVKPNSHWKKTIAPYGSDNPDMDIDLSTKSHHSRRSSNSSRKTTKRSLKRPSLISKNKDTPNTPTNNLPSKSASFMAPRRSSSSHQRLGGDSNALSTRRRTRRSLSQSVHGHATTKKRDLSESVQDMSGSMRW